MFSRARICKITKVCIFGLIILFVSVLLNFTKLFPDQKLANCGLQTLQEKNIESEDRNSRSKLFPDKEKSQNDSVPLTKIGPDSSGDSVKFIFINSYMRSGSSFLGRVLGFRSDTFYYYEPLHSLSRFTYTKGSKLCDIKKPSCEYRYGLLETMFKFLSDIFNCKLQNHSEKVNQVLTKTFSGKPWRPIDKCLKQGKELKDCLVGVEERCLLVKYRVVKVLRMSLADAALLLLKHPNLSIVHLFRDPRGTFNSHIHTGWFPVQIENNTFINDIKIHCKRITEDLAIGNTLKTMYPGRVTLVQYEDIYYDEEKAKVLYELLGMDLPPKSEEFLATLFREVNETEKSNYLSGPFKYRTSLPFEYIKNIDNECKDALEMLGLKSYPTETDLHNKEFNPVDGKLSFEL